MKNGEKRKSKMTTIDFISIQSQENFEDNAKINPVEIKKVNGKIQYMFEKYEKDSVKCNRERLLFLTTIKDEMEINICNVLVD